VSSPVNIHENRHRERSEAIQSACATLDRFVAQFLARGEAPCEPGLLVMTELA